MPKSAKKSLTVLFTVFLIIAIPLAFFLIKLNKEISRFTPQPTGAVNEEVTAVRDGTVDLFVLQKNGKYLVIDAGTNKKNVSSQLEELGIDTDKVAFVLLTHSDFDHTAAVSLFQNAVIYISEEEENMVNGKIHRVLFSNNKLKEQHQLLKDNEKTILGEWNVKTIIIPGHTAGSAAYIIDDKYLFTGDTGIKNNKISAFNEFFCMDQEQQIISLKKLENLENIEIAFTAHYGIIKNYGK